MAVFEITSLQNPKVKQICELHKRKGRKKYQSFIAEGIHLVEEAILQHAAIEAIFFMDEDVVIKNIPITCNVYTVTLQVMRKISTTDTPPPVLAVVNMKRFEETKNENQKLYFDGVSDAGNFGTMLRSALAFGVDEVLYSEETVDPYEPKVVRASQGAIFSVHLKMVPRSELNHYRNQYELVTTSLQATQTLVEYDVPQNWILIVGNEARGVSSEVRNIANRHIIIPIQTVESLNVAVATSICLYEMTKK